MPRSNKSKRRIWAVEAGTVRRKQDFLAGEEPLEILLRAGEEQRTLAITMRTAGNDYELAAGFLYNEGIIHNKHDIVQMTYCVDGNQQEYNSLRVQLAQESLPNLPQLERHFFTSSACGVCGSTMLEELAQRNLPPLPAGPQLPASFFAALPDKLRSAQQLFESTGGLHAAALFNSAGELLALREDVGRHNALDKLIGWRALHGQPDGALLLTSRLSYELIQKAAVAGLATIAAISAPTGLAVRLAQQAGIRLAVFVREERVTWLGE